MADSGTCTPSVDRHGDIIRYRWLLTSDAGGDASAGTGSNFSCSAVFGQAVGARVINSDCSAAYDVVLNDGDVDIFDGQFTNLSLADGIENFCVPCSEFSNTSQIIQHPLYFWDRSFDIALTQAGGANSCVVELYVKLDPITKI